MSSTRRIAIAAGALFILATTAAVVAATLLPTLTGPDYLMGVANHAHQVTAAATLYLIAAGASVGIAIAFSTAAFLYYIVFYRARLVPRWLSGFGIVAVLAMVTGCLLALFSNSDVTGYKLLVAPIFVQEMAFAVWLLVKGFSPSPLGSTRSSAGSMTTSIINGTTASSR